MEGLICYESWVNKVIFQMTQICEVITEPSVVVWGVPPTSMFSSSVIYFPVISFDLIICAFSISNF